MAIAEEDLKSDLESVREKLKTISPTITITGRWKDDHDDGDGDDDDDEYSEDDDEYRILCI